MPPTNARKRRHRVVQHINEEDAENIPILTHDQLDAINHELPPNGAARKILADLQQQITNLIDTQKDLKAELATRKKARTRSIRVSKQSDDDFGVGDAARYFAVNKWAFVPNIAWLSEDIQDLPDDSSELPIHIVPKKKFLLDYVSVLPASVKEDYAESDVRSIFLTDMGNIRSQKVFDVKQAAYKIFDPEVAGYITSSRAPGNAVESLPYVQELLGFKPRDLNDSKSKDTYSTKPPFIFGDGDAPQAARLFRAEIIAKTLRVILFGPSSLNGLAVANNDTYGKMWGVSAVTAPLIAFATIVVNYLLSPDREFTPTGKYSKMEYSERYVRFRTWAAGLLTFAAGRETLKFWNDIVFAGYTSDNGDDAAEGSENEDLLEEIQAAAAAEMAMNLDRPDTSDVDPKSNAVDPTELTT